MKYQIPIEISYIGLCVIYLLFSFKMSLISSRSFWSSVFSGAAGAGSSSFFLDKRLIPFTSKNTQNAMIIKLIITLMNVPYLNKTAGTAGDVAVAATAGLSRSEER